MTQQPPQDPRDWHQQYGFQQPAPGPHQWQQYGYQQPPPWAPPAAPVSSAASEPQRSSFWRGKGGAVVLLFGALGLASIVTSTGGQSSTSRTPTTYAYTPPSAIRAVPAETPAPAAAAPVAEQAASAGPKTSFGDGTWTVGEDITPGRYRSTGARSGLFEYCQITTHSDLDAQSDFLDWENGNADEPIKVNISGKVKSVKVSGCEDFVKVG